MSRMGHPIISSIPVIAICHAPANAPALMRDIRFIAAHRGGLLSRDDHRAPAAWAADVAEATAHMADHSLGGLICGAKCMGESPAEFLRRIIATCPPPPDLCEPVVSGLTRRIGAVALETWNTAGRAIRSQTDA